MFSPCFDHDLHVHLYGCLTAEDLWEMARTKSEPTWEWFEQEYAVQFGEKPHLQALLQMPFEEALDRWQALYLVREAGPFAHFQAKFNLIIAAASLEKEQEADWITRRVCQRHAEEGLVHVEYRMLFPPRIGEALRARLIQRICAEMHKIELETNGRFQPRFSLSLSRSAEGPKQYQALRALMQADSTVARMTTSVDFCFIEEGFPPKDKRELFQQILAENRQQPAQALAILYHVGESFQDKSLESAVRWIHESAEAGAHRLGHAIALGIPPQVYLGQTSQETNAERCDHLRYLLQNFAGLHRAGAVPKKTELQAELALLETQSPLQPVYARYDEARCQQAEALQNYVMQALKQKPDCCVESCPTSNLRIGMLQAPSQHPLKRFLEANLPLAIGTDDPGIFATDLRAEVAWIQAQGWGKEELWPSLARKARGFRSESLSGRWPAERESPKKPSLG